MALVSRGLALGEENDFLGILCPRLSILNHKVRRQVSGAVALFGDEHYIDNKSLFQASSSHRLTCFQWPDASTDACML